MMMMSQPVIGKRYHLPTFSTRLVIHIARMVSVTSDKIICRQASVKGHKRNAQGGRTEMTLPPMGMGAGLGSSRGSKYGSRGMSF